VLRFRDVRVIGSDGSQLGILQSRQALNIAREEGLDLVMVSPTAQPPVCKIIDFGRYKYLTEKQNKDSKKKQQEVKGIKISPRIAEHDLGFQTRKARKFLEDGDKVKVTCQFRAREITHSELGRKKLDHMAQLLADIATVERTPTLDGRLMIMVLVPRPHTGPKKQNVKEVKTEDKQNGREAVQSDGVGKDPAPELAQQPPVPAQERGAEEAPGVGAGAVQGREEAS
jgi:translation initiation factor IF-3